MTYLFFDVECCDGAHICEFGYVLTDEKFNVTKRECITINPNELFNLTGRSGRKDLTLAFTEYRYIHSPEFPKYYEMIKDLLTAEDRLVVGYDPLNDVRFLNNACNRYKLGKIDYSVFDCQRLYEEYGNIRGSVSLDNALKDLNAEERPDGVHRSDQDAFATMKVFKTMLENLEMTVEDVIKHCPECFCDSIDNFYEFFRRLDDGEAAFASERKRFFDGYVKCCIPSDEAHDEVLKDKKFTISKNMEKEAPRDLFVINQIIVNGGGCICNKASESDYYIATDDEYGDPDPGEKTRMYSAIIHDIPVISIKEFCGMAGYAEDVFSSLRCSEFCKTYKTALGDELIKTSPSDSIESTIFELTQNQRNPKKKPR